MEFEQMPTDCMSAQPNHNSSTVMAAVSALGLSRVLTASLGRLENPPDGRCAIGEAPKFVHQDAYDLENSSTESTAGTPKVFKATKHCLVRHLYVHIPFCARICPYCAFYKELLDRSQTQRFCNAIVRELEQVQEKATSESSQRLFPSTIYFGGGTPTALSTSQLESLRSGFHEQLDLSQLVEWTLEANPGSVSPRKAKVLRKLGVNRISLGVQSWDDEILKLLGREHNARQAEESFHILRTAGFENINVDLMFALPGQTRAQWHATLEKTISLQPEHVSTYCLTY
jgi:coproporphyrinogen III oxidase-like Fe-S oxidoreductase